MLISDYHPTCVSHDSFLSTSHWRNCHVIVLNLSNNLSTAYSGIIQQNSTLSSMISTAAHYVFIIQAANPHIRLLWYF